MRRLAQETQSRRPLRLTLALTSAPRTQASRSQTFDRVVPFHSRPDEHEITSLFPGDPGAHEASGQPRRRRRRGNGEADTLLKDVYALGKIVADEQKRSRVSIPASRLGGRSGPNTRAPRTVASGDAASTLPSEEGSLNAKPLVAPPPLSAPAMAVNAGVRNRRASFPPAALPPLQSWTSSFILTPEHLQATSDAHGASDIAFTLEELENTLFSPVIEKTEGDAQVTKREALTGLSAPPSPPVAPTMPCSEAPPARLEPAPAAPTADTVDAAAPPVAQTAASPRWTLDDPTPASPTASTEPFLPSAADFATTFPPTSSPPTSSERRCPPEVSTRAPLATPVLRCRLRGSTVYVSMTRAFPTPRELMEALHDAVTFIESLPALPQGPRLVRLGVDLPSAASASCAFLEPAGWTEVTSSVEERMAAQLLKERLLQRMTEGPVRGLQYIAELRAAEVEAPLVVCDTAAELLLACTTYEIRSCARPGVVLNGSTEGAVRFSFSGIGVGLFPAPSTVLRLGQAVTAMCDREAERTFLLEALARSGGRPAGTVPVPQPRHLVVEVMQHLHDLPVAVSAALLRGCVGSHGSAREKAVGTAAEGPAHMVHWFNAAKATARQWWELVQEHRDGMWSRRNKRPGACTARVSSCLTASEVWGRLCDVILSPAADNVCIHQALSDAMHSAPVRRCRHNYLAVASPAFAHTATSDAPLQAAVVDVTASSLQRTSVADLACEICEQPADVVLVLSEDVRLQQKLHFLASLHLTDSGSHHRVTVLLPGDPAEVAECISLTRSCARLAPQQSCHEVHPCKLHPCHPCWLHQLIEVSNAHSSAAVPGSSPAPHDAEPASLAELYVAHAWRRPCVTTRTSSVGLEMSAAVAFSWQRLIATATGAAPRKALVEEFQRTHLAPLVLLRPPAKNDGGDHAAQAWWTEYGEMSITQKESAASTTVLTLMKGMSAAWPVPSSASGLTAPTNRSSSCVVECGVAFLFVLDVACQSLLRRAIESPDQLNVLSIAALGLDSSAGGLVEVADCVAGDGVETLVSAMEETAAVHGIRFASLALLRWMVDNRLLLYQLTPHTIDRYIAYSQHRSV
ncbi:conserved hypothetical protein [Leishmania major strain Friedlin]|uniref:Uncharacterized protein n=1 Tax=Leishmania major TaxID=5664 RepID=Q4Q0E0_LEIMA|nr:conserved hypothetical protein [Leishmania major strain Friedlin]CAG9584176.1 hypothetical_protein_-_conserved [Leishmania major strain Friedlin]CAJ09595.1 conserved hypothetical protein [Leishmania major strain Friedlin]|eukprot:XP_001687208.1 conserved hypothetical protein [Leishmania major strain Friedlin]